MKRCNLFTLNTFEMPAQTVSEATLDNSLLRGRSGPEKNLSLAVIKPASDQRMLYTSKVQ